MEQTQTVVPTAEEVQKEVVTEEDSQATNELLANAAFQDNPQVLSQVTQGAETNNDASNIGRELGENVEYITKELYRSENLGLLKDCETSVGAAIQEVVNEIFPVFFPTTATKSDEKKEEIPSTRQLDQAFDNAIESLIKVPVAEQSYGERFVTFLKCVTFAIRLVKHYKERNKEDDKSTSRMVWVLKNVARLLLRAFIKYKLYDTDWRSLRTTIHTYIGTLLQRLRGTISGRTIPDSGDNGGPQQQPAVSTTSIVTLSLIGVGLIVGGYYIFTRYRN